jgi:hypothetical protein
MTKQEIKELVEDEIAMEKHDELMMQREISLQKWPEQLYGGDGPWNNYGE